MGSRDRSHTIGGGVESRNASARRAQLRAAAANSAQIFCSEFVITLWPKERLAKTAYLNLMLKVKPFSPRYQARNLRTFWMPPLSYLRLPSPLQASPLSFVTGYVRIV